MSIQPRHDIKVFRAAILPPFVTIVAMGLPLYGCFVILTEGSQRIDVVALFIGSFVGALAGFLWTWFITLCFTLKLTSEGVFGHSPWGIRRFVRWQDIATVKPFRFLNLRY